MSEEFNPAYTADQCHVSEPLRSSLPNICERILEDSLMKENVIDILDEVESHVERLRKEAVHLEEEKETIMTALDTLKHSHILEDITESKFYTIFSIKNFYHQTCIFYLYTNI